MILSLEDPVIIEWWGAAYYFRRGSARPQCVGELGHCVWEVALDGQRLPSKKKKTIPWGAAVGS